MERRLKVAVVGLGIWGQNHPLVYSDYHRAELKLVCDLNEERARQFAEKYNCDWTTNIQDVVNSDVEAVSVATPDYAHFEPVMTLIQGGKHVLVEKPLTTNLAEAKKMTAAAKEKGVFNMVDFHLRWNPQYMMTKEMMEKGELGKPVMGYIRLSDAIQVAENWLSWAGKSGPHWFLFPHTMDLMRWIINEDPIEVYALGSRGVLDAKGVNTWDAIQALVKFPSCFVTFETSWIVPDSTPCVTDCHMTLYGTKGKVDYDQDYTGIEISTDRFSYPWMPVGVRNRYGKLDNYLYEPMRYFVDCVLEGKQPECSFKDGLINTAMIEATLRSIETGKPVSIQELLQE